jgi:predicted acetyltransferase
MTETAFRPCPPTLRDRFQEFLDYAFYPEDGPQEYDEGDNHSDGTGKRFAIVEDGDLRSVCIHHDFTASLRGEWVPVAGLAGVATMPEYRRQGYVREMLQSSLREWRGEYPLAGLWAFKAGYYEQFGWTIASKLLEYTCDPDGLGECRDSPGTVRRVRPDEWSQLRDVHEQYALEHDLTVRRTKDWWRNRVFGTIDDKERYVYALERDGKVCGYIAYRVNAGDTTTLRATYTAFADIEALRGLLGFLADHDSQVDEITLFQNTSPSLFDVLETPSGIECEIHPGTMVRIVDVAHALETVAYPEDASGTLTLAVSDDTADWNDDIFELTVSDGRGECQRVESTDPDIRVDIETLTQLFVGYHSVANAQRLAKLDTKTESTATRLAAWLPPRPASAMDNF